MKLTHNKLKQLIKETLNESYGSAMGSSPSAPTSKFMHIARRQQEYREIIRNQRMGYFSEEGAEPNKEVNTRAIGPAYKIGSWKFGKLSGSIFAADTGIYILNDDGTQSYASPMHPTNPNLIGTLTKDMGETVFMGLEEGRRR